MFDLYPAARPEPMRLCHLKIKSPAGTRDTMMMLSEQYSQVVTIDAEGMLPAILQGKARMLDGTTVTLNDSVAALDLTDNGVLDALAAWLVAHPRVHLSVESPRREEARAACDRLRQKGLRADRLTVRAGTEISHSGIRREMRNEKREMKNE